MRFCALLVVLVLLLAGCGASTTPGASVPAASEPPASTGASTEASTEASQQATQAPDPTLVPTAGASTGPASASAAASAQPSPTVASAAASSGPNAASAPAFGRVLQLAEPRIEGEDVRSVQQRLAELGYAQAGAPDGIFGPNTDTAVRAFQQIEALEVDGIVGPRTWERLFGDATAVSAIAPVLSLPTGWLLGSSAGGRWLDVEPTVPLLRDGDAYRVPGSQTTFSGGVPPAPEVPCETAYAVPLRPQPPDGFSVAVGGSFELQPRPVSEADPASEAYRSQVAGFLTAQGILEPDVQIQQALSADLDGDGGQEIVISATRLSGAEGVMPVTPDVEAGDYSAVLVLREGQATPVALDSNVFPEAQEFVAPQRFLLVGVYDLNGDGRMEVVVDGAYYEGTYIGVYEVLGAEGKIVLGNGCGV